MKQAHCPSGNGARSSALRGRYFDYRARPSRRFFRKVAPLLCLLERYFGYSVVGWENIPAHGPALLVMNHGVLPFHDFLLSKAIFDRLGRMPRALGAKFLFQLPVLRDWFLKGGALNASRRNAEALLRDGNLVTVAPGGIYEALMAHPGMMSLPWRGRYGFVSVACKMKVPIIPSYCDGINEAYFNLPLFLEDRKRWLKNYWFSMPLFFGFGLIPFPVKLTHYLGKPVSTRRKRGESFRQAVRRIHDRVLAEMRKLIREAARS